MGTKIAQFKKGQIQLTAFDNEGNISFSLRKVYFDANTGQWRSNLNFFAHELEQLQILCRQAQIWLGMETDKIVIFDVIDEDDSTALPKENNH